MKVRLLLDNPRLNEIKGILLLLLAVGLLLSLFTYSPGDPSLNVAADADQAANWMGFPGAFAADLVLQSFGLAGFVLPAWLLVAGWSKVRHHAKVPMGQATVGSALLMLVLCCTLQLIDGDVRDLLPARWNSTVWAGGTAGKVLLDKLISVLNFGGTILLMVASTAVSLYLLTPWQLSDIVRRRKGEESSDEVPATEAAAESEPDSPEGTNASAPDPPSIPVITPPPPPPPPALQDPPWAEPGETDPGLDPLPSPPIVPYEDESAGAVLGGLAEGETEQLAPSEVSGFRKRARRQQYKLPETSLLNAPFGRESYDEAQLQERSRQIIEKLEEFGVHGTINQINPGPVVTTFEFKPDRGVKVSRITNLSEDLCLALECESILVERIPGKPTVGIEVPNVNREVISLREVVDSAIFRQSKSILTFALGKDINGKIHCADLAGMPHLLVAGQTGSGKSVMVNCVIMSILLRATPEDVRFILVDPKTVELALYRDVPHLLTPVITDMKKATNALKNATREMDRRLQLLALHGVRNIGQFNEKVEQLKNSSSAAGRDGDLEKLPYIVVIVDELADLMMLAGRQVEESIQRLAQMARAVGIHLLLATQRPSVDVITGLIKANIPARLSFLLATRVDSRTILDSMGAESLLGKGDMLFLPPGAPRMRRLHGPLVSEDEIEAIMSHWKEQASPEYENDYLESPEGESEESDGVDEGAFDDPMYRDAVQLVLEMGKASTSTLQRRLRLGYGRAARILDAMEKDGIIGPPDGSRPREVLKRPDWLDEVASG
ncbi:MAG: DNA translocase FtsK 4TM domain-containing protein [Bryobacterales bacterium]|nr:DNA translocase FtsK 4TM domain-containing protein [Bryobacterales bacterium]